MYWIKLIKEIRLWLIVRKVAKRNAETLQEFDLRVDWIGRIYTVINLPEEVASQPYSQEPYVLGQLRKYDEVLLRLQLSDIIFPEIEKIPGEDAYLLVLTAEREYLSFLRFILNVGLWTGIYYLAKFIINFTRENFNFDIIGEIAKYI